MQAKMGFKQRQGVTTKLICIKAGRDAAKIESFNELSTRVKFTVFEPSKFLAAPSTFTLQSSTQAGNLYPRSFGMIFIRTKFNLPSPTILKIQVSSKGGTLLLFCYLQKK